MNYVPVSSTNIVAVAYDATTSTLGVRFHSGSEYEYRNVPVSIFIGLRSSTSAGTYFDQNVRKAGFSFRQVR
ncbi:MAG: KTSC domain-containing protein [Thermoanaerobaculia bacterium]